MNPIPLKRPDGTLHAYACGRCNVVGCAGSVRGSGDPAGGWVALDAEETLRAAEQCCTCRVCEKPAQPGSGECDACAERRRAERAAVDAVYASLPEFKAPLPETPVASYAVTLADESGEVEHITITTTSDGGGFFSAWCAYRSARAPENNRDMMHSLSRREADAVWHVMGEVCDHVMAETVESLVRTAEHSTGACETKPSGVT